MSVGRERRQGEESANVGPLAESKAVVVMVVVVLDILRLWAAGEARSGPKPRPTRAPPTKPLPLSLAPRPFLAPSSGPCGLWGEHGFT